MHDSNSFEPGDPQSTSMGWWLPLVCGLALAGLARLGFQPPGVGFIELAIAFVLGAVLRTSLWRLGLLLILPLAVPVAALAAFESVTLLAVTVMATAFIAAFNGVFAAAGAMVRERTSRT